MPSDRHENVYKISAHQIWVIFTQLFVRNMWFSAMVPRYDINKNVNTGVLMISLKTFLDNLGIYRLFAGNVLNFHENVHKVGLILKGLYFEGVGGDIWMWL